MARPSDYTQEKADLICSLLAQGLSLRTVCSQKGMPSAVTVFSWMRIHEQFLKQYARAKQESADAMAEEILDISDEGQNDWMERHYGDQEAWVTNGEAIQRSRLRVDTRKWLMAKMKPKKYGDSLDVTSDHKPVQFPIYGGKSNTATPGLPVPGHPSNAEDIPVYEAD